MDLKLLTFLLLFGALKIHTLSVSDFKFIENSSRLPSYVCRIVNAVIRKNPDVRNVAIVLMENNFRGNMIDEIIQCMPKSKVSTNVMKIASEKDVENIDANEDFKANTRNAGVVIIITERMIQTQLLRMVNNFNAYPLFNFMSKFLIITSDSIDANRKEIAKSLIDCSIFNFGIIFEINGTPHVEVVNHFTKSSSVYTNIQRKYLENTIFPDKLKDLNGNKYRGLIMEAFTHTDKATGETTSKYLYFLKHIAKIQNADIELSIVNTPDQNSFINKVAIPIIQHKVDLVLNEIYPINQHAPKLLTNDQIKFCAFIPKTIDQSDETISMDITKFKSSIFVYIPIISAAVVWRLYKNRGANDSHWKLLFALFGALLHQSVALRKNRLILTIMVQMIILSLYFQNTIRSISLTSHLALQTTEPKYKTFNDLFRSNETFLVDPYINKSMEGNHEYHSLVAQNRIKYLGEDLIGENEIIVARCNLIEFHEKNNSFPLHSYDLLPEIISHYHNQLEASYLNPYLEKFQQFMTWSFEGGLSQMWEELYKLKAFGTNFDYHHGGTNVLFTWQEIRIIFILLCKAHFFSFIVLLCEIFYHDVISRLSFQWIRAKFAIMAAKEETPNINRWQRVKECLGNFMNRFRFGRNREENLERFNVRFINVRPINV